VGLETKSRVIGRYEYKVTQLGFKKGNATWVRLLKVLGPALGKLLETGANLKSMNVAALSGPLAELAMTLTEEDLNYFCEVFGEATVVEVSADKKPILVPKVQETHFAGQYGEMLKWLAFCVEVNYSDFMGAFAGPAAGDQAQMPAAAVG